MRLIDADSLKKHWDVDPNAMFKPASIINTIEREPTAAVGEWISAKKLFPYNGMKVLFITKSNEIKIGEAGYYSEEINYFDGDKGKTIEAPVFLDDHFEPYFIGDDEVKYWMPIPEIPKKEIENAIN